MDNNRWVPEIMYEDGPDGMTSHIPFIEVPEIEKMPGVLFMFEVRDTGEVEPGPEGEELPVKEMILHQYADMQTLKDGMTLEEYDRVREVLGLEPLSVAAQKGKKITDNIREKMS